MYIIYVFLSTYCIVFQAYLYIPMYQVETEGDSTQKLEKKSK
jgi:hypothetical protein